MTIKLAEHITVGQIKNWVKKGCQSEVHGSGVFIVTDDATLINLINYANRGL